MCSNQLQDIVKNNNTESFLKYDNIKREKNKNLVLGIHIHFMLSPISMILSMEKKTFYLNQLIFISERK